MDTIVSSVEVHMSAAAVVAANQHHIFSIYYDLADLHQTRTILMGLHTASLYYICDSSKSKS